MHTRWLISLLITTNPFKPSLLLAKLRDLGGCIYRKIQVCFCLQAQLNMMGPIGCYNLMLMHEVSLYSFQHLTGMKGLLEAKFDEICEAAEKIVNSRKIKQVLSSNACTKTGSLWRRSLPSLVSFLIALFSAMILGLDQLVVEREEPKGPNLRREKQNYPGELVDENKWIQVNGKNVRTNTIILLVGTKLQFIITQMGLRIQDRGEVVKGTPLVQPGDDLFWFNRPRLLLYLINFVLFQVTVEFWV